MNQTNHNNHSSDLLMNGQVTVGTRSDEKASYETNMLAENTITVENKYM